MLVNFIYEQRKVWGFVLDQTRKCICPPILHMTPAQKPAKQAVKLKQAKPDKFVLSSQSKSEPKKRPKGPMEGLANV